MFHIKRVFKRAFRISGRAGRLEYHVTNIFVIIAVIAGTAYLYVAISAQKDKDSFFVFLIPLIFFLYLISLAAFIRRLHDLGYSYWDLIREEWKGIFGWTERFSIRMRCIFEKGRDRPNEYGLPPEWEAKGITSRSQLEERDDFPEIWNK